MSLVVRDSDSSPSFLSHDTLGVGLLKGKEGEEEVQQRKGTKTGETEYCLKVRRKRKNAGREREKETCRVKREGMHENEKAASSRVVTRQQKIDNGMKRV